MENHLFTALSKYKTTGSLTPEENFFTEVFAFLLRELPHLTENLVTYLGKKKSIKFTKPFSIETQWHANDGSYIDLVIQEQTGKKRVIFIEIKISSRENIYEDKKGKLVTQVDKYLNLTGNPYGCFIAQDHLDIKTSDKFKDHYLGQYDWTEIYKVINKWRENNRSKLSAKHKFIINQFLLFMNDKDMKPFDGFSPNELDMFKTDFMPVFIKLFGFFDELQKVRSFQDFCRKHSFKCKGPEYVEWDQAILLTCKNSISIVRFAFSIDEKEKWNFYLWIRLKRENFEKMHKKYSPSKLNLRKKLFNNNDLYIERDDGLFIIFRQRPLLEFLKPREDGFKAAVSQIMELLEELGKEDGVLSILKKEKASV